MKPDSAWTRPRGDYRDCHTPLGETRVSPLRTYTQTVSELPMNARCPWNKSAWIAAIAASLGLSAVAQTAAPAPSTIGETDPVKLEKVVVTGSMIKRIADEGALPVSVF